MEMGSKNALVILNDANIETVVQCAINGAFFGTGQKCTASSRLIVEEKIHDEFVVALTEATKALVVGHALDEKHKLVRQLMTVNLNKIKNTWMRL